MTAYGLYLKNNYMLYYALYILEDEEQEFSSYTIHKNGKNITIEFETCENEEETYYFMYLKRTKTVISSFTTYDNGKIVQLPSNEDIEEFQLFLEHVKECINIDLCTILNQTPEIHLFYTARY